MGMVELALIGKLKKTKANIESPILTGTPQAPTPTVGDNSNKIATTEFVSDFATNSELVWNEYHHPGTILGYGIIDAYDDSEVDELLYLKADKLTTYTKIQTDAIIAELPKYYAQLTAPIVVNPGDIWFNQTNGKTYIRHIDGNATEIWFEIGSGGTAAISVPTLKESELVVVQHINNSTFSFSYTPQFIQVFVNRLKLRKSEFTATNGTSITINIQLELNDEIEFITVETI